MGQRAHSRGSLQGSDSQLASGKIPISICEARLAIRGLKTKIGLNVAVLLLLAALITLAVVLIVFQSLWIRSEVNRQRTYLENLALLFLAPPVEKNSESTLDEKQHALSLMIPNAGVPAVLIADPSGQYLFRLHHDDYPDLLLNQALSHTMLQRRQQRKDLGKQWSVFWWHPKAVLIASPLIQSGRLEGSIAAVIALDSVYAQVRQYVKPLLLYIVINTGILTLLGLYRIFRIYLRPIDRIVHQADKYNAEEDLFFAFRREDSELNRLSSALNRMLDGISRDKKKLKEMVTSLENTNIELKKAQSDIIRAEKMASIGRLAAGVAHEIGNPIGIILGYIDLLKQSDLDPEDKIDFLQRAEKEIQRINTVIRRLLDLSRPKEAALQAVSMHHVISEMVEMLRPQPVMADIALHLELMADKDTVRANADLLSQVFLNLLLNAADAIRDATKTEAGNITIKTQVETSSDADAKHWLLILCRDDGSGINPDQIENIFDPFFTTKEPGRGTGLGLAVSYMIVEEVGGTISAQSRESRGTEVRVRLPLFTEHETRKTPHSGTVQSTSEENR